MYIWNFDDGDEIWYEEPLPTIEDCLKAARNAKEDYETDNECKVNTVYIGNVVFFEPHVDVDRILDDLQDAAYEECGEASIDWEPYNNCKREELNELEAIIDKAITDWLKKYGYEPKFSTIENVKEYKL